MSLIHWDPFADVEAMFGRMMPARWPRLSTEGNGGRAVEWSPAADISETDKEYVIRTELPAVRKEDVQVTLDNGVITIRGQRKQRTGDKSEKFHRIESFVGTFERSFALPENVNPEAISCDSKDGVLTVHLPKSEIRSKEPKRISVQ
jgi:HSP20 family protein